MWEVFRFIFDSWPGVSLLLAAAGGFTWWRVTRHYAIDLLIPAALLLLRKAAFYLPIAGTISTQDRIIFWSLDAYLYVVGAAIVVIFVIAMATGFIDDEETAFWLGLIGILTCCGCCGYANEHQSLAFIPTIFKYALFAVIISPIALIKTLIVSPLLLPLTVMVMILHFYNARFGRLFISREIGKLVVICVPAGGVLQFLAGLWQRSQANVIAQSLGAPKENEYVVGRMTEIFSLWRQTLPEINQCGINAVPSYPQWLGADCKIRQAIDSIPNIVSADTAIWWIPVSAAALICLAVIVERGAGKKARRNLSVTRKRKRFVTRAGRGEKR